MEVLASKTQYIFSKRIYYYLNALVAAATGVGIQDAVGVLPTGA
jgi:hypothetical protein